MECIMICGGHLFLKCVTFAPGVYKRRFHVCFPVPETSCSKAYRVDHLAIGHYDHYSAYAPRWGHEDTRLRVCMEQPPYLFKRDPFYDDCGYGRCLTVRIGAPHCRAVRVGQPEAGSAYESNRDFFVGMCGGFGLAIRTTSLGV